MTHYRIYLLDKSDHFLAAENVAYEPIKRRLYMLPV